MLDKEEIMQMLLSQMPIPPGSCITFDMGYVDYEAWQKFTDDDIIYVTREKKKCRYKVLLCFGYGRQGSAIIMSMACVISSSKAVPTNGATY